MNTRGLKPNFTFIHDELNILEKKKSHIIFVNGGMDPWLPACVQEHTFNDSTNLPVITLKNAAHHLDSFLPLDSDRKGLKDARN